jgi:hypothetical protein
MVISIQKAEYKDSFKIAMLFSDGIERTVDFESFLKQAKNPMTKKYLNKELFKSFKVENGDVVWNDYEMCFPIWDLHEGKI